MKAKGFTLYRLYNGSVHRRFGFSVSKKTGNAVKRNLVKRLFREVCRNNLDKFPPGYDYVFITGKGMEKISYRLLKDEVLKILEEMRQRERNS